MCKHTVLYKMNNETEERNINLHMHTTVGYKTWLKKKSCNLVKTSDEKEWVGVGGGGRKNRSKTNTGTYTHNVNSG